MEAHISIETKLTSKRDELKLLSVRFLLDVHTFWDIFRKLLFFYLPHSSFESSCFSGDSLHPPPETKDKLTSGHLGYFIWFLSSF
mmetsp:Transcript_23025/g.26484  ORF Transcript_23025/g.26484 Transcript_23025/m.26484 type:complete len:85 (+) Transcript_23025:2070-2324(+)